MALVQSSSALRTQGANGTISLPSVAAGNSIFVICSDFGGAFSAVSGSVNGSFTKAVGLIDNGNNSVEVWYKLNTSAGSETISFTPGGVIGDTYISARAIEWSGVATASALDRTGTGANSLTATASAANTQADDLVIHASVCDTGNSALGWGTPSGYTLLDRESDSNNFTGYQSAYKVVSATETSTGTATSSALAGSDFDSVIATFKLSSAPTSYDLAYGAASYALTGSAETLSTGRALPVAAASYALTATAQTLAVGRKLDLSATSYAITTSAETLATARKLDVAATSYVLSAADVTLTYASTAKEVDFGAVSYSLSTAAETLALGRALPVTAASYALTTSAQTLAVDRRLDVGAVSYAITPAAVTLSYAASPNRSLAVDPVSYSLGLADVTLGYSGASGGVGGYDQKKKQKRFIEQAVQAANEALAAEQAEAEQVAQVVQSLAEHDDDEEVLMLLL